MVETNASGGHGESVVPTFFEKEEGFDKPELQVIADEQDCNSLIDCSASCRFTRTSCL